VPPISNSRWFIPRFITGAVRGRGARLVAVSLLQGEDIKPLKSHQVVSERESGLKAGVSAGRSTEHIPGTKVEGTSFKLGGGVRYSRRPVRGVTPSPLWTCGLSGRENGRTGENSLRLRRAVGAPGAPGDTWWREVSRGWLPEALTAPMPAGGVPAALPPSPSCPVRLSGVTTALAGREVASLKFMEVRNTERRSEAQLRGRIAPRPRRVRSCGGQHQGSEAGSPITRRHLTPGRVSKEG